MANTWEVTTSGGGGSSLVYKDEQNRPIFTISGLSSTGAVSSYFTVNDDRSIKVSASALAGLGSGSSISVSDNYTFVLDSGIANKAEIIGTSLSFAGSGSTQTVTGSLSSYYELTNQQSSITFHDIQTNQTLATIGGLSTNASLSFVESSGSLSTIRLDKGEDLTSTAVSLSLSSIAGVDIEGYGLKFALYESTTAKSASSAVGFGSLSATWGTVPGGFVYKSNNDEGWTLSNDGMGVSHAGKSYKEILKITGFTSTASIPSATSTEGIVVGNPYVSVGSAYQKAITTTDGTTFTVYEKALPTTGSGLQLTTLEGASAGTNYGFSFAADEQASLGGSGATLGMSNGENYWYRKGTTLNYQYDTSQGWSISGLNVTYTGAKTSLDSTADPTTLVSISGLSSVTTAAVVTSGLSVSDSTITILNTSFFDTSADGKTATFTDKPGGLSYTLALSSAIAQSAAVNYTKASDTSITVTGTSAVIKGKLDAYYSLSGNVVTYHASQANQPLATIMGLATGAQFDEFKGDDSVITLDLDDLGTENVFLTTEGYSGIKAYSLALSATGSASVGTLSQVVDSAVSATVSLSDATVNGKTEKYYTLSGTSVTYHAPEDVSLATITGLSTTATVDVATDGRTLKLSQDDLTASNVILDQKYVGKVKEHGLSLALVNDSGSGVSKIGGDDSGNYWTVSNGSASYQHYTTEAWEYTNSSRISYTAAKKPDVWFSISGLSNTVTDTSGESATINGLSVSGTSVIIDTDYLDKNATIRINKVKGKDYTFNLKTIDSDDTTTEVGFGNKDGKEKYWKVERIGDSDFYKATYQYDVNEGWELKTDGSIKYTAAVTKDLAVITGIKLSDTFNTDEGLGITATSANSKDYTFKLNSAILGESNITLAKGGSAAATDTFSLEIAGAYALNGQSVYGFNNYDAGERYWTTNGDSAIYQYDTAEGWALSGTSQINYSASSLSQVLAEITGLKDGVREIDLRDLKVTVPAAGQSTGGLIELDETVIPRFEDWTGGHSIKVVNGSYSIKLKDGIDTIGSASHTIGLNFADKSTGVLSVLESLDGGWLGDSTGTEFTYYKDVHDILTTVTGLSANFSEENVSLSGTIIGLKEGALTTESVSLSGTSEAYTFRLLDENGGEVNQFGFSSLANAWSVDGTSAAFFSHSTAGWAISGTSEITYTSEKETRETLTVIENLKEGLTVDENGQIAGISVDEDTNTISLSTSVLSEDVDNPTIKISDEYSENSYSLALAEDTGKLTDGDGTEANDDKVGFIKDPKFWTVNGESAIYQETTNKGWERLGDGSISFAAASTATLAYITGLSNITKTEKALTLGGVSVSDNVFSLSSTVLGTAIISLSGKGYSLALMGDDGKGIDDKAGDNRYGFKVQTPSLSFVGDSATYLQDRAEGWTLSGMSVTYTPATSASADDEVLPDTLFTLTGLSEGGNSAANISVNDTTKVISIKIGALSANDVSFKDVAGNGYSLSLADDDGGDNDGTAAGDNKIGFDNADHSKKYWAIDGTVATYQFDVGEGWELSGNSIIYHAQNEEFGKAPKVDVTLTGISSSYSAIDGAISGITILDNGDNKKTILISDEELFGENYSESTINLSLSSDLKTGAYSLSLASSLNTGVKYGGTSSVSIESGGTATVIGSLKSYFTISKDKQTVTRKAAREDVSLAVISGLSEGATEYDVTISGTIITLGVSALGYSNITVTNENGIDDLPVYKFDLESGVSNKKDVLDEAAGFSLAIDGNTATIKGRTKVYYTLLDSKAGVSYHAAEEVTLGTITGLSAGASLGENVSITLDANGGISIGLSNAALGAGNIALNDLTSVVSGANKLYFTLADDDGDGVNNDGTAAGDGKVGFVAGSESLAHIGTEAVVRRDVGAGWTLDRTGKKITYTAEKTGNKGTVLAKVTGLNSEYNTTALVSFDGTSTIITLGASALGEGNVVLTTTNAAGSSIYALALSGVDGTPIESGSSIGLSGGNSRWSIVDGVAYLKQDQTAGWTFTSDQFITYSPMTTGAIELASVTGLKSTLKGGLKVDADGQIAGVTVAGESIILSSSVLGTDKITLKDTPGDAVEYKLALGGDVVQDGGGVAYWTSKGTTSTYKKDTQAYYSLSGTSSVVYTAGGTKTLATLTNLPKGLVAASTGADRPATIDGITVLPNDDDDMLKILVGAKALGTDAKKPLKLSGTSTADQLAFDTDVVTKQGNHVWTYGTTTTLKEASIAGGKSYLYELAGGSTQINYNTPTISKNAIVTLGGLVKTVSVNDIVYYDGLSAADKTEWEKNLSMSAAALSHAVILKDTALDNKNVTLTNLTTAGATKYNLFLYDTDDSKDTISMSAPVIGASSTGWTLNKTNAIYTGDLSQGYTLGAYNEKKGTWTYTYSAAKEGATLFTIGGLPNDIKEDELKDIIVELNEDTGIYEVTVPASILVRTTGKLTLKGTGYVFKLPTDNSSENQNFLTEDDEIVSGKDSNGDGDFEDDVDTKPGVDVWRYSGNTATYKRVIPAHYALTNDTTISYVKEADVQITNPANNKKKISKVYATISGLPKGLTVVDDYSGSGTSSKITDGTIDDYISVNTDSDGHKVYTLDDDVLDKVSSITFTPGTGDVGTNTFDGTNLTGQQDLSGGVWSINGTTATLKMGGKKAGWVSAEDKKTTGKITYTKKALEATGTTALQITGLAKGLTVDENGQIAGITVSDLKENTETKEITGSVSIIKPSVYGASPVVFKRGKTATNLDCSAEDVSAEANQEIWSLSGTTLTIQKGTTASYTYDGKGTVTYKKANPTSTLVKITGLAKDLTLDQVQAGITVTDTTITLDNTVLGTTSVTASNNYKIELKAGDTYIPKVEYKPTWSFSGEKATLKAATTVGFDTTATTKNGTTTLKYNAASAGNVLLTIDGLKKGLNVTTDVDSSNKSNNFVNAIDGIDTSELTFSTDKSTITGGTITVSDVALNSKTVTLKNNDSLSKATLTYDDDGKNKSTTTHTIWEISGTTGKLYNAEEEGYRNASTSNNTVINYYNGKTKTSTTPLATVSGLKKSLKVNADGSIDGITVDRNKITLDEKALGTTNVTIKNAKNQNYSLVVADSGEAGTEYRCTVKGTTVTIREFTPASYELDGGVIKYTGAKQGDVVATLSGVVSGLKADAEGNITGIKVTHKVTQGGDSGGKPIEVKLGKEVFGTTAVTLNPLTDSGVQLAVEKPSTETYSWRVDNDNLILTTNYSEGYKLSGNKATYTTGGLVNTVITGLKAAPDSLIENGQLKDSNGVIEFDNNAKTITVMASEENCASTVTIAGGDYTLALQNDTPDTAWEINGTTAIFYKKLEAGKYTCDGVKISQVTADRTEILATITGLPEGMTADDFDTTDTDADGNTIIKFKANSAEGSDPAITTTTKLLDNTTNIKLTGNGYKLAFADEAKIKPHATGGEEWSLKGTTATLAKGTTAGYTLSADGKTATYSAFAMAKGTKASATITNLNSTVKLSEIQTAANTTDKTIKLTDSMLGTKDLTITGSYKFKKDRDATDAEATTGWTADKKGTATYQNMTGAYYTFSDSKVTYNAAKAGSEIAKVTGLNKSIKAVDGKIDGIDVGGDYISLSNSVLAGGNVSVSGGGYKLSLKYDVPEPESTDPELSLNKTTAYLKNSTSAGYTVNDDEKGITYHKASNNTIATLTGLKKGIKYVDGAIEGVSFDGDKTITVSDLALGTTNVSLTNNLDEGYELALDRDSVLDDEDDEVKNGNDTWSTNKTTVTFKNVTPAHYELDEENNVIKYVRDTDATTYASITGVKNFDEATNFSGGTSGGTITLYGNNIAGNVGVTSAEGTSFKLALGDDSLESKVNADTLAWSYSTSKDNVRTAKLSGKVTAGYVLEENDTKISAQKVAGKDFAVISGVNVDDLNTFIVGADDKSVTLDSSQLEEAVTVSTSFGFEVQFTAVDTKDTIKTITGSTGADNIAVWCSGVEVSLGGGDDHVYIATTGNTIVYGAGDGNDVIDGFTTTPDDKPSDKLKITKGSVDTAVENEDGDVVLTVKDGSTTSTITLKNTNISATSNNEVTYEAEGKESTFIVKAASADLLYDEESNFVTAGSQLNEITPVTPAAQSLDEDFTSPQNFKLLTKQNSLLAYFNSKKK